MTATSLLDACGLSGGGDEGGGERETVSGWEIAEIVTPETPAALSADPRAAGLAKMPALRVAAVLDASSARSKMVDVTRTEPELICRRIEEDGTPAASEITALMPSCLASS